MSRPLASTIGARHLPLRDEVLQELRSRILDGVYRPGERLTEDRLAEDFGVSRNPVREALRMVEAEGFVQVVPRRGAVVTTPDEQVIADLFAVRARLEPLAARLAAERITDDGIQELRDLLDAARTATDRADFSAVAELNTSLHLTVIQMSENRWLEQLSAPIYRHVHWVFRLGAHTRAPHSWTEHVRLVEALAARDPEAAEQAAVEHVHAAGHAAAEGASAEDAGGEVAAGEDTAGEVATRGRRRRQRPHA